MTQINNNQIRPKSKREKIVEQIIFNFKVYDVILSEYEIQAMLRVSENNFEKLVVNIAASHNIILFNE